MTPQYINYSSSHEGAIRENNLPSSRLLLDNKEHIFHNYGNIDNNYLEKLLTKHREFIKIEINKSEDIFALMQLADIYFLKQDFVKSGNLYNKVLTFNKNYIPAYDKAISCAFLQNSNISTTRELSQQEFITFRNKVDNLYKGYLIAIKRRVDILHAYCIFKLSFFLDDINLANEVINNLEEILEVQPNNHLVLDTLGFVKLNLQNDVDSAKKLFIKALKIDKKHLHSLNNLAVCYIKEKEYKKSFFLLNRALKIDPSFPLPYENLASIYLTKGHLNKAMAILDQALSLNITLSDLWQHQLGWLYIQHGFFSKAKEIYLNLIQKETNNNLIYNNLGICYLSLGDKKNAEINFNKSVNIYKQIVAQHGHNDKRGLLAFYNLGKQADESGNLGLLQQIIKDLQLIDKDNAFAFYLLGVLNIRHNKFSEAKEYFTKTIKKDANIKDAYVGLSFIYSAILKKYTLSEKILNKAIQKKFLDPAIFNNLAFTYIKSNNLDSAERVLKNFKTNTPLNILPTLGLFYFRKNDLKTAKYYFNKALNGFDNPFDLKTLEQIQAYEEAYYWFRNNNKKKAKEFISSAKRLGKTYMREEIEDLEQKL